MTNSKASVTKSKKAPPAKAAPKIIEELAIPPAKIATKEENLESAEEMQHYRDEAWQLEMELEKLLLRDAVFAARLAIQDLHAETYSGQPHERRRGMRIKEKAIKVDLAFNRLRALRKGDLLPIRQEDEW